MKSNPAISLFLAFALTGCSSIQATPDALPQQRQGEMPHPGSGDSEAYVGNAIYKHFDYQAVTRAVTLAPFGRQVLFATIQIPMGQPLFKATVGGKVAWCSANPTYFAPGDARSMCFFEGAPGRLTQGYVKDTISSSALDVDIPYHVTEIALPGGFSVELVYQGLDNGVVKMTYREYKDDLARPAFQQDLSYTLERAAPTRVRFRSAQIEILSADNSSIRYRMLSGL